MTATDQPEVLDLTGEMPAMAPVSEPSSIPVDVWGAREGWRGRLAMGLLVVLALTVAAAFAATAFDWTTSASLKDLLALVFSPLVGLFGAVIGFYFGTSAVGGEQTQTEVRTKPKRPTETTRSPSGPTPT